MISLLDTEPLKAPSQELVFSGYDVEQFGVHLKCHRSWCNAGIHAKNKVPKQRDLISAVLCIDSGTK